jgi:hypothetical protein
MCCHVPGICQCFGGTPQSRQKVVNLYHTTACHVPKESCCDNHHQQKLTSHKSVLFDLKFNIHGTMHRSMCILYNQRDEII